MAIHGAAPGTDGLELWNDWSRKGAIHKNGECAYRWNTFHIEGNATGRTTLASLFRLAKQGGWDGKVPASAVLAALGDVESQAGADAGWTFEPERTELENGMVRYELPDAHPNPEELAAIVRGALRLLEASSNRELGFLLLAIVFRAPLGEAHRIDFSVWLAGRQSDLKLGHDCYPDTLGNLVEGLRIGLDFCADAGAIDRTGHTALLAEGKQRLTNLMQAQGQYIVESDEVDRFLRLLRASVDDSGDSIRRGQCRQGRLYRP